MNLIVRQALYCLLFIQSCFRSEGPVRLRISDWGRVRSLIFLASCNFSKTGNIEGIVSRSEIIPENSVLEEHNSHLARTRSGPWFRTVNRFKAISYKGLMGANP